MWIGLPVKRPHCTEVHFASFLSDGFTTMAVINQPERKLAKRTTALHRGAFCQFPFRWICYYGSNKSTKKESVKMHLCALCNGWKQSPICFDVYLLSNVQTSGRFFSNIFGLFRKTWTLLLTPILASSALVHTSKQVISSL